VAGPGLVSAARVAALAGFGACAFAAFPQVVGGRVVDGGLVFAWLAPALALLALDGLGPRRAAWVGFLAFWLAHAAILHWIYVVTSVHGKAPAVVGVLAPIGLALYPAAFGAALGAFVGLLRRRGWLHPLLFAAAWAALDHGRHHFLSGFPWGVIGYAQHGNPWLMGLAPYGGVVALSFVTALGGAGIAGLLRPAAAGAGGRRSAAVALGITAAALAAGALSDAGAGEGTAGRLRVGLLQGNIDQGVKWSPGFADETMHTYEELSRRAVAAGARLVVWPETAVPGSLETEPGFGPRVEALARELGVPLLVGAVGVEPWQEGWRFFDSAYLYDAGGARLARYDKAHLVPFGEYLPFRRVLGRFMRAVATGIARDDVTPGPGPRALELPLDPDAGGAPAGAEALARGEPERPVRAGVPICYELLFPGLVRQFAAQGGELLIGITNDAWYGRTGAPYQFLAITELRSAETRLWTARAANTGVTALIDQRGRVVAETGLFEETLLVGDVPLLGGGTGGTFYVRHGDWFAGACWGVVLLAGALAVWPRRGSGMDAAAPATRSPHRPRPEEEAR